MPLSEVLTDCPVKVRKCDAVPIRDKDEISLILGNRPITATRRFPNLRESLNLMPPKTLEVVEMLLDLAWHTPGPRSVYKIEDEFFHGECGLPFIEGGPDFSPIRWQSSKAEDVAVPGDSAAALRRIDMTDELQEPH